MISRFDQYEALFKELDKNLKENVHFYIIGGAVMLYYGLKTATKDIDIVVESSSEFRATNALLKELQFESHIPSLDYKRFDLNQIFVRNDYRIDLFQKIVCRGFRLSEGMKKRAEKVFAFQNLTMSLCSLTDIFMFKTFTERPGDIDDCTLLAQEDIDWPAMLVEIKEQISLSEKPVWITYVAERLDLLAEEVEIPIKKDIDNLRDEFFESLE